MTLQSIINSISPNPLPNAILPRTTSPTKNAAHSKSKIPVYQLIPPTIPLFLISRLSHTYILIQSRYIPAPRQRLEYGAPKLSQSRKLSLHQLLRLDPYRVQPKVKTHRKVENERVGD